LIVRDLSAGPRRFVELQRVLPGISTEQLRSRLNRMVADGMLTRQRFREVPPRVEYGLTERAQELMPVLGALARWGYEWAWSAPRSGEAIDLGAVFRLAGGLLPAGELTGTVGLAVRDSGHLAVYTIADTDGRVTVSERAESSLDAQVTGDREAWISALSPEHDRGRLEITGDGGLAGSVLDWLAGIPAQTQIDTSAA
jgi:DNA-binding HxlR family transcriptional regulator